MFLSNVRIVYRLSLLAAVSLLILAAQGVFNLGSLSRFDSSVSAGIANLSRVRIAVDQARQAQVDFKKQVQEWKNILIRGNSADKFAKYSKQFEQEHGAVLASLQNLKATLGQLGLPADEVDKAAEVHRALFRSYTAALKSFDPADPETGKKVDAQVSGIDREPTRAIDAIVERIVADGERMNQAALLDTHALNSRARLLALLVIAAAAVILGLLSLAIIRSITRPLRQSVGFSREVAAGNLDARLEAQSADELGVLARTLQDMVASLKEKMLQADQKSREAGAEAEKANQALLQAAEEARRAESGREAMLQAAAKLAEVVAAVTAAVDSLSARIDQTSRGSDDQSRRVGETAVAMEEMTATVLEVARNAALAAETASSARVQATEGERIVAQVVEGVDQVRSQALALKQDMDALGRQAEGIGRILNVIADIADQTNLLALNAAIEAARAGDAGRGFAVVADEVRKLAEKTMTATKEVDEAIRRIQESTRRNVENVDRAAAAIERTTGLANSSGGSLRQIVQDVIQAADQVRAIAAASEEQSAASEEINRSVEEVSTISGNIAQAMSGAAQAVSELTGQVRLLESLMAELKAA